MKKYHKDVIIIDAHDTSFYHEVYGKGYDDNCITREFEANNGEILNLEWIFEDESAEEQYPELFKYCNENDLFLTEKDVYLKIYW